METVRLSKWEELEERFVDYERQNAAVRNRQGIYISPYLFRGHANSDWDLDTTLERWSGKSEHHVGEYYHAAAAEKPYFEAFTGKSWKLLEFAEYDARIKEGDFKFFANFPSYEYLAYLRHHGFPSPLLDWSASPYIAAFFAFRAPTRQATHVSIYSLREHTGHGKSFKPEEPRIFGLGPNVNAHPRHFLQQSQYTVCYFQGENQLIYAPHSRVVSANNRDQDAIVKYEVPISERGVAIRRLHSMNVTAYSLFGTEDALAETVATKIQIRTGAL